MHMATIKHRSYLNRITTKVSFCFGETKLYISNYLLIIRWALYFWGCFLFVGTLLFGHSLEVMFMAILLIFISNMVYALSNFSRRLTYTLFLFSFFSFLLGRMTVDFLTTGKVGFRFDTNINLHILVSIFISLIFLQVGFEGYERIIGRTKSIDLEARNETYIFRLRIYSLASFYISAICFLFMNLEQFEFVRQYSYISSYYAYNSHIPKLIQILGSLYKISYFIFLATCPRKNKCILPISIFSILSMSILLTGNRSDFVINMAIQVVYVFWRQYRDREIWISRIVVMLGIFMLPLVFAGLSYFVYLREGIDIGEKSVTAQFIRYFKTYGKTVDILGYGKKFEGFFPRSFYSVGELIDYIRYNSFSKLLFGEREPNAHTIEYVMNKHSFAHVVTYLINSNSYLSGHGEGSSYIAELYHDFGYIGIAFGNMIYGILLCSLYKMSNKNPIKITLLLSTICAMFYSPRGSMFYPISVNINLKTLSILVFLYFSAKKIKLNRIAKKQLGYTKI